MEKFKMSTFPVDPAWAFHSVTLVLLSLKKLPWPKRQSRLVKLIIWPFSYKFQYLDGGQIDGQEIMVTLCKPQRGGNGPVRRHKFDHDNRRYNFYQNWKKNFLDLVLLDDPLVVHHVAHRAAAVVLLLPPLTLTRNVFYWKDQLQNRVRQTHTTELTA